MTEEKATFKSPSKSPGLAGFLAVFFPGMGAIYNAQYLKGLLFIIVMVGLITLQGEGSAQPWVAFLMAGFYIYQIIDSVQSAKQINQLTLEGKAADDEASQEEMRQAVKSGSVFWGILLIALGVIFLLANFEVISYGAIFDFWPIAIIIIGLKLILDYAGKEEK